MDYGKLLIDLLADKKRLSKSDYLKSVCGLFDIFYNNRNEIPEKYYDLLYFIANDVGVPHYLKMFLGKQNFENFIPEFNGLLLPKTINESMLHFDDDFMFTIFQYDFIHQFKKSERIVLSAPTSFGKTTLIYPIISKFEFKKIALIFPTISLLVENTEKMQNFAKKLNEKIQIISLSEDEILNENFCCIFTPERFISFINNNPTIRFDFVFFDEFYKIDNTFLNENEEDERDKSYRIALQHACDFSKRILLGGPYLDLVKSCSFENFCISNNFVKYDYNEFELVAKRFYNFAQSNKVKENNEKLNWSIDSSANIKTKTIQILKSLDKDQSIVYCSGIAKAEEYALFYANSLNNVIQNDNDPIINDNETRNFNIFINHLENRFSTNWSLVKCLKKNIAYHHGSIPKYIQKKIIYFFNKGIIKTIFSTTTITEGVNTQAKNVVVTSASKGNKPLKSFDAKNIAGRAGRFLMHYSGHIFILNKKFSSLVDNEKDPINHKNYDINSVKDNIDIQYTSENYLTTVDKIKKVKMFEETNRRCFSNILIKSFPMFSLEDKVIFYDKFLDYLSEHKEEFEKTIKSFCGKKAKLNDIDLISKLLILIPEKNDDAYRLFKSRHKVTQISTLAYALNTYLHEGFAGSLKFNLKRDNQDINKAIRHTHDLIFKTFKHHLVKYIGLLELTYREILKNYYNVEPEKTNGLNILMSYLEYGVLSLNGKRASDFGLPFNVIEFIENETKEISLDEFEKAEYENYLLLSKN